ncbi:MAG: DUF4923 family protein [Muribaculaceae bacterium]|nr:DUF4923 family protein [Muribaculaceae bacterium]
MKKTFLPIFAALAVMMSSCLTSGLGTSTTGGVLGSVLGTVLGNVLLGGLGFDQSSLLGNWTYSAPAAAFTTEQSFAAAGGATTTTALRNSLASSYNELGISSKNTAFNFGNDNKFSAKVNGIAFDGTYDYNATSREITLKTGKQSIKGNVMRTANGMGLMFDAGQMTKVLQTAGGAKNADVVAAVSKLGKSNNGSRVGFELTK